MTINNAVSLVEEVNLVDKYFDVVRQEGLHQSPGNLRYYMRHLFQDIAFTGKRMLDIGGGTGLFSFYASV